MEYYEGELERLLASLAFEDGVFARSGSPVGRSLTAEVYALVLAAEHDWAGFAVEGAVGPSSASDVAGALTAVTADTAVELMAYLSADDLVFPGSMRRNHGHALRAAERVAEVLGHDATWLTNIEGPWQNGRSWAPVSRHTFDGVVAGISPDYFAVLLQVGED